MYSVERVIEHNTLFLADILDQGYNSNPFSRTRKAECIALGFFVCCAQFEPMRLKRERGGDGNDSKIYRPDISAGADQREML